MPNTTQNYVFICVLSVRLNAELQSIIGTNWELYNESLQYAIKKAPEKNYEQAAEQAANFTLIHFKAQNTPKFPIHFPCSFK